MQAQAKFVIGGAALGLGAWWLYSMTKAKPADTATGEASGVAAGVDGFLDVAFNVAGGMMPGMYGISLAGLALIKRVEGYSAKVYTDVAGFKTIGYGHKLTALENMQTVTESEAARLLAQDVAGAEAAVNRYIKVTLTQAQFDALVSFVYNVGAGAFARSTMLQKLNAGDYAAASAQFARWNIAGGKVNQGLSNRRAQEVAMFNGNGGGGLSA